jgi:hypothetical protein
VADVRGSTARRGILIAAAVVTLVVTTGLGVAAATGAVARAVAPRALLTATPPSAFVGQLVVADVHRSTLPPGSALARLTVNWGDGSKAASLASLKSKPAHRYARPGRFTITETLVDRGGQSGRSTHVELVARPQRVYWDLFNGQAGLQYQLESAALPLAAKSSAVEISGTSGNKLRCTAGMAVDAKARLWVLSYPNGCSAPYSASLQVFTSPVTQSSTPAYSFALPGVGDDDNMTFDRAGNLWVEDAYNSAVYEFSPPFVSGTTLIPAVTLTNGISRPSGIAVDAHGDVVVSNVRSTGVHSITVFHAPVTSLTTPTFLDGLQTPGGLIFDARGNLYASNNPANGKGSAIVRYNSNDLGNGATPSVIDRAGVGGIHGVPYEAGFAWDALGNLYLADCGNEASLKAYPLATTPFSARLSPSVVYTNPSITMLGCAWGIGIR